MLCIRLFSSDNVIYIIDILEDFLIHRIYLILIARKSLVTRIIDVYGSQRVKQMNVRWKL